MKAVVIDNWISARGLRELSGRQAAVYRAEDGKVFPQTEYGAPRSHGTICAAILAEAMPDVAELTVISAAGEDGAIMIENLCTALAWCIKSPPDYLCMSLGTSKWLETRQLGRLTEQLAAAGTTVFAACANDGRIAFPAAYRWVTGVRYQKSITGLYREEDSPVGSNLVVGEFATPVLEKLAMENSFFLCRSNSMAAPYALGKVLSEALPMASLPQWTGHERLDIPAELPMPVVGLTGSAENMGELLALLQKESYQAAWLTDRAETDWVKMVLHVTADDFQKWVDPLMEAGILLLDMENGLKRVKRFCDYIVGVDQVGASAAYERILDHFGAEDKES